MTAVVGRRVRRLVVGIASVLAVLGGGATSIVGSDPSDSLAAVPARSGAPGFLDGITANHNETLVVDES
jgi:hypothetical protein